MKPKKNNALMPKNDVIRIALMALAILLVPFIAMQFTSEVNWGVLDFIVIGALLFGTGLLYKLITRKVGNINHRIIIGVVLAILVILVWVELAVGIFD